MCTAWGFVFIGPSADAIARMGVKANARETMIQAGVPVVPGSDGAVQSLDEAFKVADRIGFPIAVKASAGGGGRGIRIASDRKEFADAFERAQTEALSNFGSDEVYLEKYLLQPRHIEIQVLADHHGHVISLGERESSIQRRRQKLLEEAPSTALDPELRQRFELAAVKAATAVGYRNAGTIEFLLDATGEFYFMEMNTRIQVEHPCTEAVTGVDIVKEQIRIAQGEPLGFSQADIKMVGWSVECRINAEDSENDFRPSPGLITRYDVPGGLGVRIDSGVTVGSEITSYYDSMIAKIITWGRNRPEALARMRRALLEFRIEGIATTIPLHLRLLDDPEFQAGHLDTTFLERRIL